MGRGARLLIEVSESSSSSTPRSRGRHSTRRVQKFEPLRNDPEVRSFIGIRQRSPTISPTRCSTCPGGTRFRRRGICWRGERRLFRVEQLGELASGSRRCAGVKLGESGGFLSSLWRRRSRFRPDCKSILRYQCCCVDCRKGLAVFGRARLSAADRPTSCTSEHSARRHRTRELRCLCRRRASRRAGSSPIAAGRRSGDHPAYAASASWRTTSVLQMNWRVIR